MVGEETAIDDVSIEAIPDEDIDESEPVSEFYTETGEIAAPDETEDVDKTIEEAVLEEFREKHQDMEEDPLMEENASSCSDCQQKTHVSQDFNKQISENS